MADRDQAWPDSAFNVGSAVAVPGRWTRGQLVLGHYPDGPITTPVNILCGARPGPVLWVQAAIHGSEIGGALGILKLLKALDARKLKGAIVGVMAANPPAFRAQQRNTPLDGENLNRHFPGRADGALSPQMAHALMETAYGVADAMMDLHSGGNEAIVPFYAIYWDDRSAAAKRSAALARAAATPDIWRCTDGWISGAMFAQFVKRGKPGMIIECGGGGALSEREIANHAAAIRGVATALGIVPGRPPRQKRYRVVGNCKLVYNRRGGYFLPAVGVGDAVKKGQLIGRIVNPHGDIVETIRSPHGPGFISAVMRPYLPLHAGVWVAECNRIEGYEKG